MAEFYLSGSCIVKKGVRAAIWCFLVIGNVAIAGKDAERRGRRAPGETLIIGMLSDPKTLNPLAAASTQSKEIIDRIFLKLMEEQSDFLHFLPRLAESWEFSGDSLEVTFHLRRDVAWTDGRPCTAEDVRFTWQLQRDTLVAWSGRHLKERISDVEVLDDFTVVFHFTNRYPYQLMDANDGVILPKHILGKVQRREIRSCSFGRNPVGNGPFKLSRWVSGQYVEIERNPGYYEEGKPLLGRVVFRIVPDMLTLVSQLKSGDIDCLESIPPEEADLIEKNYGGEIKIYRYPSRSMTFIAWNMKNEFFKERDIRRALTMAINREEIIATLWKGMAEECTSPMHRILWAYDDSIEPIPYDPEEAGKILRRYGWEDRDGDGILERGNEKFRFEMMTNYGNQRRVDILTMVQAYLEKVGVRVDPRVLEWNLFIDKLMKSDFESCVTGWKVGTRADLTEFWHSESTRPGGFNRVFYINESVDKLLEQARNTLDARTARDFWSKCQRIIYEDQPFTFLAIPYEINALRKRFCGAKPNAISFYANLRDWRMEEGCD